MPDEPTYRYRTDVPVTARRTRSTRDRRTNIPSFTNAKKQRKAVRTPAAPPPVLVRNRRMGTMTAEKHYGKHRRRMDLTLGVPGAEIRLPALPEIRLGWRIISFLLVVAFGAALAYLWTSPTFHVAAAGVAGDQRVTAEEINTVIGVAGQSIFSIDQQQVYTDVVNSFPEMSAVTVEIKLPAFISITVAERQPVITWIVGEKTLEVDAQGMAWYPRSQPAGLITVQSESPLPAGLVSGTKATQLLTPADVQGILSIRAQLPAGTPLLFDLDHGVGWEDARGWKVYFGFDFTQMQQKLVIYEELIDELKQKGIQPKFVSVEYMHAPYFRAENFGQSEAEP